MVMLDMRPITIIKETTKAGNRLHILYSQQYSSIRQSSLMLTKAINICYWLILQGNQRS